MKVYLSWSGKTSKKFASIFHSWLFNFFRNDLEIIFLKEQPGTFEWNEAFKKRTFAKDDLMLLFITYENFNSPWIAFESAWARNHLADTSVLPFLLDVTEPDFAKTPLEIFDYYQVEKSTISNLVKKINKGLKTPMKDEMIELLFENNYSTLQGKVTAIPNQRNLDTSIQNIFISWSKNTSKEFAIVFESWLEKLFDNHINAFISTEDIPTGEEWMAVLSNALSQSDLAILCITSENLYAPWLNFEAGWLIQGLKAKIDTLIPLLLDVAPNELSGSPISNFQSIPFNKEGIKSIVERINAGLSKSKQIPKEKLDELFDLYFSSLNEETQRIIRHRRLGVSTSYFHLLPEPSLKVFYEDAVRLIRYATKSIEIINPSWNDIRNFKTQSQEYFGLFAKAIQEQLIGNPNIVYRAIYPNFYFHQIQERFERDIINDPHEIKDPEFNYELNGFLSLSITHFSFLTRLQSNRININIKRADDFVELKDFWMLIDGQFLLTTRSRGFYGENGVTSTATGYLTISDTDGKVLPTFYNEFLDIWDRYVRSYQVEEISDLTNRFPIYSEFDLRGEGLDEAMNL